MLRNRSRRAVMAAEQSSLSSPSQNPAKPLSSFLGSPRIFNGFWSRSQSDSENSLSMSPTSILDGKLFLNFGHPFGYDRTLNPSPIPNTNPSIDKKLDSGVGLALINSLSHDKNVDSSQANNSRMVLFGSNLKVKIPSLPTSALSPIGSPKSPADFGIKTPRSTQFLGYCLQAKESPSKAEELSLSEMEISEDYTCVITHGPNPKTTHVFDDCIVESCCGVVRLSELKKENGFTSDQSISPPVNSLSFCQTCNIKLGEGKDIYMYRGDKSFRSYECLCQEMLSEGIEKL